MRIKVHGNGSIGFGSGTMISSTPQETLILTCAHIFKLENGPAPPPSRFPRKITIDLFDGNLSGAKGNQVHYSNETFEGEAVDYDFNRDVGLIRIRPGRRLPYARVVPPHWKPKANMGLITVGCSEGHDATAWSTVIVNPTMKGLNGNRTYEAIECMVAPKQGRSGGGLFTSDGYIAGVCDFAEPQGNHGLYAAPTSIYKILDRNDMMALYAPVRLRPPADDPRPEPPRAEVAGPRVPDAVSRPQRPGWRDAPAPRDARDQAAGRRLERRRGPRAGPPPEQELAADPADPDGRPAHGPVERPRPVRHPRADPRRRGAGPREVAESRSNRTIRRPSAGRWRAGREPLPELTTAEAR